MSNKPGKGSGFLFGWAFTMIMAGALLVGALVAYGFISTGYEEQLERRLKSYAATSAIGISPGALDLVESSSDDLAVLYRGRLKALQENSGVRRAAILRRDGTLVVDTEGHEPGSRDYGFAADANELEQSFKTGPVATITYEDDEGRLYRNGFAPVRDADGVVSDYAVAVELEADYTDNLNAVAWTMALTVLSVFVVTAGSAFGLSRAWRGLHNDLARQTRLAEQAQFSAGMAHQIKNPLAALRGYVELLARGLNDPMQKQIADKLVSEIGALDRIVRDFLQFSRGAHGSVEKLSLEAVLRPVVEAARSAGGDKVEVPTPDVPPVELEVDSTALREALSNVAVNAAEAMREDGGRLTLSVALNGRLLAIEIQDTGPGIGEDVRGKLFEPFVTGKADGTGLGLPIARRLLRDLGGDLEMVRSDSSGTMFRATFVREAE
ncbi:MAG: HAMP domain-containing histidine kinase [Planctomycetes bacterium]|nr:HAMP domain-containing histidine kinase [Planctomycetota bacterium]